MTIASLLDEHPDDHPAVIEAGVVTTYGELRDLRDQTRSGLVAAGLEPGDRVGIVCSNSRGSVVSILAAGSAGMIAVPLSPSSPAPELNRELEVVGARLLLTGTPVPEGVQQDAPCGVATPAGSSVAGVESLATGPPVAANSPSDDELAVLMFTSGTAGFPKAAMVTHGNLTFCQRALIDHPAGDIGPESAVLVVLPMSHMYGLNVSLLTTLRAGGTVVLADGFDAREVIDLISEHQITQFAGVPPMWRALLALPDIGPEAFSSIRRMASGAAPLPTALWHDFHDRFGIELSEGYGLTETSPLATSHVGIEIRPGSVGQAVAGVEIVVVDHEGRPAPADDSGEVLVRGPNVFAGYWQDEEATKAVIDDEGWLHTGDVGVLNEAGYLHLVDRAKDLIIVSGFNVYPFEVEAVLIRHPAVEQAVVVGRDDELRGERIVAYVTAADVNAPPDLDDVVEFCRLELARYKAPSELHVVETLPIAPTGKRIRRELG